MMPAHAKSPLHGRYHAQTKHRCGPSHGRCARLEPGAWSLEPGAWSLTEGRNSVGPPCRQEKISPRNKAISISQNCFPADTVAPGKYIGHGLLSGAKCTPSATSHRCMISPCLTGMGPNSQKPLLIFLGMCTRAALPCPRTPPRGGRFAPNKIANRRPCVPHPMQFHVKSTFI